MEIKIFTRKMKKLRSQFVEKMVRSLPLSFSIDHPPVSIKHRVMKPLFLITARCYAAINLNGAIHVVLNGECMLAACSRKSAFTEALVNRSLYLRNSTYLLFSINSLCPIVRSNGQDLEYNIIL